MLFDTYLLFALLLTAVRTKQPCSRTARSPVGLEVGADVGSLLDDSTKNLRSIVSAALSLPLSLSLLYASPVESSGELL
jgi:hypothetical protein